MEEVASSVIVSRRWKQKKAGKRTDRAGGALEMFGQRGDWKEGMTKKDLNESLQRSFISYLNKRGCHIRRDLEGPITLYGVRMKESALKRIAQETRLLLQMDSDVAEKQYREIGDLDVAITNLTPSQAPFVPPFLEYDMTCEGRLAAAQDDMQKRLQTPQQSPQTTFLGSFQRNASHVEHASASTSTSTPDSPAGFPGFDSLKVPRLSPVSSSEQKSLIWQRYDLTGRKVQVTVDNKDDHQFSIFRPIDRIRLLTECVNQLFRLDQMVERGIMNTYYVLHQQQISDELLRTWGDCCNLVHIHEQPVNDIREYFGENIAIYFAWVGFSTQRLFIPGLVGLAVFIIQCWFDPYRQFNDVTSNIVGIGYSFYITLWAQLQMNEWDKIETSYRLQWTMNQRRQLKMESRRQIDERKPMNHGCRRTISIIACLLFVGFVLGVVSLVFSIPLFVKRYPNCFAWVDPEDLPKLISIVNVTFISIFDFLWCRIAYTLTNYENWMYEDNFQGSLVFKIFVFRLINYFNSFFYLAFVKEHISPCLPHKSCTGLLKWNVIMIILSTFLFNSVEIGTPYVFYLCSRFQAWFRGDFKGKSEMVLLSRRSTVIGAEELEFTIPPIFDGGMLELKDYTEVQIDPDKDVQDFVKDYLLTGYGAVYGILEDYMEIVLQFCFVTLFSMVLPIVPFIAYVSNALEIRSDAYKLLKLHRRPFPGSGFGLGPWKDTLKFTCYISIVTNTAMCVFTMGLSKLTELSFTKKLVIFVVCEHLCVLFPLIFQFLTPDESKEVEKMNEAMNQVLQRTLYGDESYRTEATKAAYGAMISPLRAAVATER